MSNTVQILFGLFGGLAVFIYGMNMMSECLQKAAGEKMKAVLALLTKNPVLGVLAGALTTAVLQSSSATTVMAIGFVSAGLMTLPQAISIIFGANIGTTMTAQIIAFKISDYIFLIIFVGFLISFLSRSERIKNIGLTIFAFGLLFLGIDTMGSVMQPLANSPVFTELFDKVSDIPVLGVLTGTVMTLVVQSSSATIAVLQNFAIQPGADGVSSVIGLTGAIPILLGDNIGTTITAVLASIGQPRNAKRTAAAHCIFNVSGCLLFIWFIRPFAAFIQMISPKGPEVEVISRQIANAHTTFNIVMTLIWTPLLFVMVKLVMRLIPDKKEGEGDPAEPVYLDDRLMAQPAAALQLAAKEILHLAFLVGEQLHLTTGMVRRKEEGRPAAGIEQRERLKGLGGKITEYLSGLFSAGVLTEEQAAQTAGVMYLLGDVERMGELCVDVTLAIEDRDRRKTKYSKEAMKDLEKSLKVIEDMYGAALQVLTTGDEESARKIRKKKEKVLDLDIEMRKGHMDRVSKGKCATEMTGPLNDILHAVDRMGNCCVNIADAALDKVDLNYFNATGSPEELTAKE
ncbi:MULTISPECIES: Na/Pi cotransporter family protein [Suilimivivens]|uniref:Na/Pi cotransporter family protein n=1 Tax=Suilimivivens aceti TaxID=2981774 RepID=A0ABT2T731_9FIRM|nr:Na/Pi cotransporter family protein [Suilimivivens aceti]MCU6745707.1 Na/Pi cotransporter family protein [Suilimivivens aceti]SCI30911.1 Na/Pi-cotransporter II-related protein [uncultured Clostridium sp.]